MDIRSVMEKSGFVSGNPTLDMWQSDVCGAGAVYAGMKAVHEGKARVALFAVAEHPMAGSQIRSVFGIGRRADGVWRYCLRDPEECGSHNAADSAEPLALAVAQVAYWAAEEVIKRGAWGVFRVTEEALVPEHADA